MGIASRVFWVCAICAGVAGGLWWRSAEQQAASVNPGSIQHPPATAAAPENQTADATQTSSDNLLENRAFLKANPKYVGAIRQLITLAGYECPRISFLWYRGESPYGEKLEALCGPPRGSGTYPTMHYAIYPKHFKVDLCEKFGVFGGSCPGD